MIVMLAPSFELLQRKTMSVRDARRLVKENLKLLHMMVYDENRLLGKDEQIDTCKLFVKGLFPQNP